MAASLRMHIPAQGEVLTKLREVEGLQSFAGEISLYTQYLSMAEGYLPEDHEWVKRSRAERESVLKAVRDPKKRGDAKFKAAVTAQLRGLKAEYVTTYTAMHKKARLTHDHDKAKSDLVRDYRVAQLQKRTAVDLLNRQQLIEFQDRLGKLKACFALTEKELEHEPKCRHCGFWPSMEPPTAPAGAVLDTLKAELGKLQESWTQSLLDNLGDPVVQSNFALLKPEQNELLQEFIKAGALPDEVGNDLVQALQEVLSGLSKVSVKSAQLKSALFPDGSPATPAEFKERFEHFVEEVLKGRDPGKVRIVMEG